jgi:hypothetical protein
MIDAAINAEARTELCLARQVRRQKNNFAGTCKSLNMYLEYILSGMFVKQVGKLWL